MIPDYNLAVCRRNSCGLTGNGSLLTVYGLIQLNGCGIRTLAVLFVVFPNLCNCDLGLDRSMRIGNNETFLGISGNKILIGTQAVVAGNDVRFDLFYRPLDFFACTVLRKILPGIRPVVVLCDRNRIAVFLIAGIQLNFNVFGTDQVQIFLVFPILGNGYFDGFVFILDGYRIISIGLINSTLRNIVGNIRRRRLTAGFVVRGRRSFFKYEAVRQL
jgi:hypothetical protein